MRTRVCGVALTVTDNNNGTYVMSFTKTNATAYTVAVWLGAKILDYRHFNDPDNASSDSSNPDNLISLL
jgi:hypothetical protein